jgi:hypothetical protein
LTHLNQQLSEFNQVPADTKQLNYPVHSYIQRFIKTIVFLGWNIIKVGTKAHSSPMCVHLIAASREEINHFAQ